MKSLFIFFAALLWAVFGFFSLPAKGQSLQKPLPYTLVFKLKPTASTALARASESNSVQKVLKKVSAQPAFQKFPANQANARSSAPKKTSIDLSLIYELHHSPTHSFEEIRKQLLATGQVEYVERLNHYEPLYQPNDPHADSVSGGQRLYLKKIMAYAAWDITKGDPEVVIGIIDTGARLTQEDLVNKVKVNEADPIDGIDNDGDGYIDNYRGWDVADNDNDPTADASGHGTSVAAVAVAEADNGKGIAGVGFNCKFLPIKAYPSVAGIGTFKGYEGIVYAADHGCKVINLSWGGAGYPSAFEQDIINYAALEKDVVLVAAAGNTNAELDFYPASYQNVVSVGGVTKNDVKHSNHTYSYAIDIAAQSSEVFSAYSSDDSSYGNNSGTSMASPIVAGAAALVRSHFKNLTALQVGELLRVTADDIYTIAANEPFKEKLGTGRLNVKRALTEVNAKSVRIQKWNLADQLALKPGDQLQLFATFQNFLAPLSALSVNLTTSSPYLQVERGTQTVGAMATLATASNTSSPFLLRVAPNTPPNTKVSIRFGFTDGTYTDYQYITLYLNSDYITTDVNHVLATVTSRGNVAYDGVNFLVGNGVKYKNSSLLLAEAGLLIGYSPTQVSDNVRNEKGVTDQDFYATSVFQRKFPSVHADFEAYSILEDSLNERKPLSVQIRQNVFAWAEAPHQDFVVLEYILTNRTAQRIEQAFAGIFADWDLVASGKNVTEWNNELQLGITRHVTDASIWAGVQLLSRKAPGFYAIDNTTSPANTINISDGFSTAEKYQALSGGVQREIAGNADTGKDVSFIISAPIKALAPEARDTVTFALVFGNSRSEILAHAQAATDKYRQMVERRITGLPTETATPSVSVFPNPTTGELFISLPAPLQNSVQSLQLIDAQGRVVFQLPAPITLNTPLNLSHLSAGVYFLKITTPSKLFTNRIVLTK
ncbi:S8/S53 family peptidase [Rufibacter quisquiliarum]|uniref:Subtilisin family serine protease n=1 Tax=Rufibacter quisquiliarum TaxID=1549639 RepID=A0A839GNE0_9BACT|nr:S8/S53 family peptidase [Rufibacter quisquiliarum]MBA9076437.1 subtilisin family serine protease [Rufibacter quisquiliarum]